MYICILSSLLFDWVNIKAKTTNAFLILSRLNAANSSCCFPHHGSSVTYYYLGTCNLVPPTSRLHLQSCSDHDFGAFAGHTDTPGLAREEFPISCWFSPPPPSMTIGRRGTVSS